MFTKDKEIIVAIVTSTSVMVFLVGIIVAAIIRYQSRSRSHNLEVSNLKIKYQEEMIKAQFEKEEQTLTRISQEIHDNIGQILSLVKLNLNTLDFGENAEVIQNKVGVTKELVTKAIHDLRELSKSLNATHLSKGYLSDSLSRELDMINKSGLYITSLLVQGDELPFNPQKQLIICRIAQEALNNIIKHANAHKITFVLDYTLSHLTFTMEDDGVGFVANTTVTKGREGKGTGLDNMQNRAEIIGAKLTLSSVKGAGTTLKLVIPVD